MDKTDVEKLWALLRELYPRQKQKDSEERKLAWALALEPFSYGAVRQAALAHARESDYYPSVAELVKRFPRKIRSDNSGSGYAWQKYIEERGIDFDDKISVSRYMREHSATFEEDAAAIEALRKDGENNAEQGA